MQCFDAGILVGRSWRVVRERSAFGGNPVGVQARACSGARWLGGRRIPAHHELALYGAQQVVGGCEVALFARDQVFEATGNRSGLASLRLQDVRVDWDTWARDRESSVFGRLRSLVFV
jgi:hypothetical protein